MARVVLVESFRPVESRIVKYEIILYIKKKKTFPTRVEYCQTCVRPVIAASVIKHRFYLYSV